jgi:hypothetical protein
LRTLGSPPGRKKKTYYQVTEPVVAEFTDCIERRFGGKR